MPSQHQVMICRVCQRVLDRRESKIALGSCCYQHNLQDRATDLDHLPDPIPMPEGFTGGRCDFCNLDGVAFELPVTDISMPLWAPLGYDNSAGNWAACAECGMWIAQGKWFALVIRVVTIAQLYRGKRLPTLLGDLRVMYGLVRDHTTGPLRPIVSAEG